MAKNKNVENVADAKKAIKEASDFKELSKIKSNDATKDSQIEILKALVKDLHMRVGALESLAKRRS